MPRVTYLIPTLENNDWLISSIKSIEQDNYRDKGIIVVNNGRDLIESELLIEKSLATTNIKVIQETNPGVAQALNAGIDSCDSEYIARLDSDDLVIPGRTQRQFDILDRNKELAGVGGSATLINERGEMTGRLRAPEIRSIEEMRCTLRFENPYIHPAMMLRTSVAKSFRYDDTKKKCQDWDLWMRIAKTGKLIINISNDLIKYRRHPNQESVSNHSEMDSRALRDALLRFDKSLEQPYMYQRDYLESTPLATHQLIQILIKESRNIKNIYSLKKFAAHLYRATTK